MKGKSMNIKLEILCYVHVLIHLLFNKIENENPVKGRVRNQKSIRYLKRISIIVLTTLIIYDITKGKALFNKKEGEKNPNKATQFGLVYFDGAQTKTLIQLSIIIAIKVIALISITKKKAQEIAFPEYMFFIIINKIGCELLIGSTDKILTLLGLELKNFTLYLKILFSGSASTETSDKTIAVTLKYFILSALTTCSFTLGLAFIYFTTGTLSYEGLAKTGGKSTGTVVGLQEMIESAPVI